MTDLKIKQEFNKKWHNDEFDGAGNMLYPSKISDHIIDVIKREREEMRKAFVRVSQTYSLDPGDVGLEKEVLNRVQFWIFMEALVDGIEDKTPELIS